MEKWIQNISGQIPHTNKSVQIDLDGKNLIITGANGAGKTSFLREVFRKVDVILVLQKKGTTLSFHKEQLSVFQNLIKKYNKGTQQFEHYERNIEYHQKQIDEIISGLSVEIPECLRFSVLCDERKAVVRFFEEKRLADISEAITAKGVSVEEENAKKQPLTQNFGNNLEQHLVNLKSRQSLAITQDKNQHLADNIENWFANFERNLRVLFEDETLTLPFDSDRFKFSICQSNKPPFTFQTLSAGYRAIFDIYAELIMRTEYFKVLPQDLTGVVFIDEIDSHLHVSLQRLILPFFANSFPKIQFIVTTHSPFVLMSTPDTVVFDLAKNEPITEDLSHYTYSAVMKGLWNIKPISVALENSIKEISRILHSEQKDFERLERIVDGLKEYTDALDSESKAFLLQGMEILEENNV